MTIARGGKQFFDVGDPGTDFMPIAASRRNRTQFPLSQHFAGAMEGIVQRAIRVCRQPHDSSVGRASNAGAEGRLTRLIRASEYHIRGRGAARQRHVRRGTWIGKS